MVDATATRRLSAIVSADVVGYSRLLAEDETATLAAMKAHHHELWLPEITAHGGRVVGTAGDGLLVEFQSAVAALECALAVQRGMTSRNVDLPPERRMLFRLGINIGDVVVDGDDIFGDGVNIAARLEAICQAGGICISDDVMRQVRGKVDTAFTDGGPRDLKNIPQPVHVWHWHGEEASAPETAVPSNDKPAIAVLPFANTSGDPEQEYFSDGLTEDLITALAHWRSFPVIARNSSFAYKGKSVDVVQTGRELGARYLLEGSVRKSGERIRITAQLVNGANGHHIWAERYDRRLDDIFEVQDEITQRIAAIITPELVKLEAKSATPKRPEDLDAWDFCLRGMEMVRYRTADANAKARELFESAVALQPDYADAHAGLSFTHHMDILLQNTDDRKATATLALEAARSAVRSDEASSSAHQALSTAYQWLDRNDDAVREARISVDLNPNNAAVLHSLGNKLDLAGAGDGIELMEKAQSLNPRDAQMHSHLSFLARAYAAKGDHADAADRAFKAVERGPNYANAYYVLAIALGHLGRIEEGVEALATCDRLHPGFVAERETWQPYVRPESNEALRAGIRKLRD